MLLEGDFLQYRPSQIASASLILSMKMNNELNNSIKNYLFGSPEQTEEEVGTLWNEKIEKLTGIDFNVDIKPVFCKLVGLVHSQTL